MKKLISFLMTIVMFLFPTLNIPHQEIDKSGWNTDYAYVLVHGLNGWGERDPMSLVVPYFGSFTGSVVKYLRARGLSCYAASVSPADSAWDRACELYAQLAGCKTDYGEAHSAECGHARYGKDYTGKALIPQFDAAHKVNLLGHSFGGATVMMFLELMANGDETERAASAGKSLSALFEGGKADWIYSLTTLAAPINGSTVFELNDPETIAERDPDGFAGQWFRDWFIELFLKSDRPYTDTAAYDMQVDRAIEIAELCETIPSVYYFSLPCTYSKLNDKGESVPLPGMVPMFLSTSRAMGMFTGVTKGGVVLDETWQVNDGLVNTISERAPFNAPQRDFDPAKDTVEPGIWNVFPTLHADHMIFNGGFLRTTNIRPEYVRFINMVNSL